ncbi:hypothetical protein GCM10023167_00260 [Brevibacterium pityocampae]|uniref:Uncharacterized protein n=1 Tax=Brevibacterium pityocampae TaxID=506594 RepID=A0ABP8IZJ1_9MICO
MRQREDDDVVSGEDRGGRLLHGHVRVGDEVRLVLPEPAPCCRMAAHGCNVKVWMPAQEAQDLAPGVPGGP